ncbi:DUF3221 domain-containing protein [Planococcus salinus]|uniref:DUF3221 domain-containing protein n=1 Tax=Planococcus salinus TaxID=1848460 RepID=A0A3M8P4U9_9BACL|nr:DUF3221 domain-containing protein [Planococcus salinus]RNF38689.1 DUF3221 domain-containing protein [Planococcus salinus]
MKKKLMAIGMIFLLTACGTSVNKINDDEIDQTADAEEEAKVVSGREIIASLEQTTDDTVIRDEKAEAIKETTEFKEGYMGEPTDELAEDLAVQQIEGLAATEAIEQVYGGYEGVNQAGVIFYENQSSGAEQSGFWFGVKEPDERLDTMLTILQEQVDTGKILAEPIYIYQSPHTEADNRALMDQAAKPLKEMAEAHHNPDAVSYSISADTITGALEIGHNFLTEEQQEQLVQTFPEHEVVIEQQGTMVPLPGEPDVVYPDPETVNEPSAEGYYLVSVEEDGMLAVAAKSQDFSSTGGVSKHFSAINFAFQNAAEKLDVGQRVLIEASGPIAESYPGQGRASFVEVLPAYQPEGADLIETQVVQRALETAKQKSNWVTAISSLEFNEDTDQWVVGIFQEDEEYEVEIEDK